MDTDIDKRITIAAALIGYPKEAITFVLRGWSEFEVYSQTHIDGETLCWRLHDYALNLYGPNTRKQLKEWKVTATSDFGNIVFGLAEHGLIRKTETEKIADFENVFEFENQFLEPKFTVANRTHQWNLSTLFVVTTLCAIVISGFTRRGFDGILPALFSSWFAIAGVSCIVIGLSSRSKGWLFLFCFGIIALGAGLFAFYNFSYW